MKVDEKEAMTVEEVASQKQKNTNILSEVCSPVCLPVGTDVAG